jgi:hypothetical protein
MANNFGIFLAIGLLLVGGYFLLKDKGIEEGFQSTSGDLIRTVPINGGGSFNVVYSGNHSGSWGAIVEDSVSSNCKFSNGKTTYKSVILGEGYTEQTVQVTGRNCKFSGNFNLIHLLVKEI